MQIGGFQAAFQGIVAFDELQLRLAPICTSGANRYIAKVLRGAACEGCAGLARAGIRSIPPSYQRND